jgi:hypothetical protein
MLEERSGAGKGYQSLFTDHPSQDFSGPFLYGFPHKRKSLKISKRLSQLLPSEDVEVGNVEQISSPDALRLIFAMSTP